MARAMCPRVRLWESARNACRALMRAAVQLYQGHPLLADECVRAARLRVCRNCVCNAEDRSRCGACGCFVGPKVMLTTESCPKGYWY